MRPSPFRHTLAVLRTTIGLTQKEMAALLECSTPTIQAIELGKLRLSDKLAERLCLETGVSLEWLLEDDVSKPPVTLGSEPMTKDTFVETRAARARPLHVGDDVSRIQAAYVYAVEWVGVVLLRAAQAKRTDLYIYKLMSALQNLGEELGEEPCLKSFIYGVRERDERATWFVPADTAEAIMHQFFEWCAQLSPPTPKRRSPRTSGKPSPRRQPG